MTTHSSPCFCYIVPLMPSLKVSLSSQTKPSGECAFKTGGLISNFITNSLCDFIKSFFGFVHFNFFYLSFASHKLVLIVCKLGKNNDRKFTILQRALVCLSVLGNSKFLTVSHLSLSGV